MALNDYLAWIEFEHMQTGNGRAVQGQVAVQNQTSLPVSVSSISITITPPTAPANATQPYLGGGGGGAAVSVSAIPYIVNASSTLRFPFQAAVNAAPTSEGNATFGGYVTLSDGTIVVITSSTITAMPAATGTPGSGLPMSPPFMQNYGAAQFAASGNTGITAVLTEDGE